ncbi:ABC transporter permease [Deferrisoma palaeochoriense]
MTLLKIAFRNVLKNRRRSLITVLAIAFGYMAVVVFRGYTENSYRKIALGAIFVEAPGHVVVFKEGFEEAPRRTPEEYLFSPAELDRVLHYVRSLPEVVWAGPKLEVSGLVTNGDISTIFLADAIDGSDELELWSHFPGLDGYEPKILPAKEPRAAYLAPKLARLLEVSPGDGVVVMGTTLFGQMNALDLIMRGHIPTLSDAVEDKYLKMSLRAARDLLDFDGASRVGVLLRDGSHADRVRRTIERELRLQGLAVTCRTWDELSDYYRKVKAYLDVVFLFLFSIVLLIVVMGVVNTMSMAVFERVREVGTLRAIGLKPRAALQLFALEGLVLGAAGSLGGAALSLAAHLALRTGILSYTPPGVAGTVRVEADLSPETLLVSAVFFALLALGSSVWPARRAARIPVVDALGHV